MRITTEQLPQHLVEIERLQAEALGAADGQQLASQRRGAFRCLEDVSNLAPDRVVLVSCDLGSFQRELRTLAREGYTLEEIEGFDMFPRTPHLEAAAKLRRTLAVRPR